MKATRVGGDHHQQKNVEGGTLRRNTITKVPGKTRPALTEMRRYSLAEGAEHLPPPPDTHNKRHSLDDLPTINDGGLQQSLRVDSNDWPSSRKNIVGARRNAIQFLSSPELSSSFQNFTFGEPSQQTWDGKDNRDGNTSSRRSSLNSFCSTSGGGGVCPVDCGKPNGCPVCNGIRRASIASASAFEEMSSVTDSEGARAIKQQKDDIKKLLQSLEKLEQVMQAAFQHVSSQASTKCDELSQSIKKLATDIEKSNETLVDVLKSHSFDSTDSFSPAGRIRDANEDPHDHSAHSLMSSTYSVDGSLVLGIPAHKHRQQHSLAASSSTATPVTIQAGGSISPSHAQTLAAAPPPVVLTSFAWEQDIKTLHSEVTKLWQNDAFHERLVVAHPGLSEPSNDAAVLSTLLKFDVGVLHDLNAIVSMSHFQEQMKHDPVSCKIDIKMLKDRANQFSRRSSGVLVKPQPTAEQCSLIDDIIECEKEFRRARAIANFQIAAYSLKMSHVKEAMKANKRWPRSDSIDKVLTRFERERQRGLDKWQLRKLNACAKRDHTMMAIMDQLSTMPKAAATTPQFPTPPLRPPPPVVPLFLPAAQTQTTAPTAITFNINEPSPPPPSGDHYPSSIFGSCVPPSSSFSSSAAPSVLSARRFVRERDAAQAIVSRQLFSASSPPAGPPPPVFTSSDL